MAPDPSGNIVALRAFERRQPADDNKVATPEAAEHFCPECGGGVQIRIAYGYPSREMFEASERNELALGGCVIDMDSPSWQCRACGHRWGGPPSEIDGLAAFFPGGAR